MDQPASDEFDVEILLEHLYTLDPAGVNGRNMMSQLGLLPFKISNRGTEE